jgi:hypothetical protein
VLRLLGIKVHQNYVLSCQSTIDHFLISNICDVETFEVLDLAVNYSDHVLIAIKYICNLLRGGTQNGSDAESLSQSKSSIKYFRWDYADIMSYYYYTGEHLCEMLDNV